MSDTVTQEEFVEAVGIAYSNDPVVNGDEGFDDVQGSLNSARVGASAPTTGTLTVGGVDFQVPAWSVNNTGTLIVQTSHRVALYSVLEEHIHYAPESDGTGDRFQLQFDVAVAGKDGTFTIVAGSPFTVEHTFATDESGDHNYLDCCIVPGLNTTVSTLYLIKITRIAATVDEYAGDIFLFYADGHIMHDQVRGSRQELVK